VSQKDGPAAKAAAQEAAARLPDNLELEDALGRSHLAVGEVQQAIAAFGKVAAAEPDSVRAMVRLADAHLLNKDPASAARLLKRGLELEPRSLVIQGALLQIALRDKRPADALVIARAVQRQRPKAAVGYLMETDIHTDGNQLPQAIAALNTALRLEPATPIATRLHALLSLAKRNAEADLFASGWLKDHPNDAGFLFHLGSMAMDGRRMAEAEARYRAVIAIRPNDPSALNNLAWVISEQKKPGALAFAQRANELAPEQAPLMDTLASVLAADGQLEQALNWQRRAVAKSPGAPNYRLRLAQLLIQSGDKAGARNELDVLAKLGDRYSRQAEVTQLMKTL
jgi:cellulose synthase operon protein C